VQGPFTFGFFLSRSATTHHPAGVKIILFALSLVAIAASGAESLEQDYAGQGRLIVTQFVSAPFPHASRAAGRTYQADFYPAEKHYSDSTVAIFIPKYFRETGRVDFVVHFHGWRNTVAGTLQQFKLIEQLVASGKNAVLIVPEGPHDAPDSGGGKLEDREGFKRFMDEATVTLRQRGVFRKDFVLGDIILSGHSGGYLVMSAIVDRGGLTPHIKEVWLFDALYAQGDKFLAWSKQPGGRLLNIYTDDGGTKTRTEEMIATLKERHEPALLSTDEAVLGAELQTNRFIFLHTDMTHNEVVAKRKTFLRFLETSCLSLRLEKPGETSRLVPTQLQNQIVAPARP
jgi:hypothetical protein